MLFGFIMIGLGILLWCMKPNCSRLFIVALVVFGCLYPIYKLPSKDWPNGNPEMARWFLFLSILDLALIVFLDYINTAKQNKVLAGRQAEIQTEKMHNIALQIYSKCEEKKIKSYEIDKRKNDFEIIARSFGIEGYEEARKYYNLGAQLHEQEKNAKQAQILLNNREKEYQIFEKSKNIALLKGREKYTAKLINNYNKKVEHLQWSSNFRREANSLGKQRDWAVAGGMAEGIAGSAAGVAVALDVQKKNNQSMELASAARGVSQRLAQGAAVIEQELDVIRNQLETLERKICDESNVQEKFSYLSFKEMECYITEGGNIRVTGQIMVKNDIRLFEEKAKLDGSLNVLVKNKAGEVIAEGYYSPPGFGVIDMNDVGFENHLRIYSVCIVSDYSKKINVEECLVEIRPVNMWIIEI